MARKDSSEDALRCSFCNKSQREVKKLIAGPAVFICDECVDICLDIIAEDKLNEQHVRHRPAQAAGDQEPARSVRDRPGAGQAQAFGRGLQPLQADRVPRARLAQRRRAAEVEHPPDRPDRHRQDPAGADPGAHPLGALHDRRRHHPDRSGLRGRGRREHHPQALPGRRATTRKRPSAASSTSTRSTRSPARATTPRSPATCRARACSRPC